MMPAPLSTLRLGEKGTVSGFALDSETRQRLSEMGLTKGVECTLVRIAPMGDPIEIMVRGYRLSLRISEAGGVLIAKG